MVDEANPTTVIAIFRFRVTGGLVLLMPESAEFTLAWDDIDGAELDLKSGTVRVHLSPAYVAANNWTRGARTLSGQWMDRHVRTG